MLLTMSFFSWRCISVNQAAASISSQPIISGGYDAISEPEQVFVLVRIFFESSEPRYFGQGEFAF